MKLKAIVVLLFFSALALTVLLFLQIPQAFIPTQDRASVFTIVEEPEGVTIEYIMEKVEQIYSSVPEVESYLTLGGFSPRGCGKLTLASLKAWRFYPQRETLELVYTSSPMSLPSDSIFPDSRAVLKPLSLTTWAAAVSLSAL